MNISPLRGKRLALFLALVFGSACICAPQNTTTQLLGTARLQDATSDDRKRLLYNLPVTLDVKDQNGIQHTLTSQTADMGEFSATVYPGHINISVNGVVSPWIIGNQNYEVYLTGSTTVVVPLQGLRSVNVDLHRRDVPATSAERTSPLSLSDSREHVTLSLIRINVPRGEATDRNINGGRDRIQIPIVDAKGRLVRNASVQIVNPRSAKQVQKWWRVSKGMLSLASMRNAGLFVYLEAPGYSRRTFVLYGRGRTAELYDENSTIVRPPAKIVLTPRSQADPETVSESVNIVDTSRTISFDAQLISTLPLPLFRNPDDLILLAPGVAPAPETYSTFGPSFAPGIGTAGAFSINGLRSRDNNFDIDGSDYNDEEFGVRRQGFITPIPQSIESLDYYEAVTADGDSRYGRSLGGEINALSKSGTRQWHVTLYGLGTGGALRSRNFFEQKDVYQSDLQNFIPITTDGTLSGRQVHFDLDPSYHGPVIASNGLGYQANPLHTPIEESRVSYGFTVGGPITKKGTYLYASFEREGQDGNTQSNFSVPTMKQRGVANNGDTGGSGTCVDILCLGNYGPYYPATPSGNAIFSLFPFPNNPIGPYGPNTYTEALPVDAGGYIYSARLDQDIADAHKLTVRVNDTNDHTDLPSVGDALFSSLRAGVRTTNVASYFTSRISSKLFNTFRFSFGDSAAAFSALPEPFLIPSKDITSGPDAPFLLNAPLMVNLTSPGGGVGGIRRGVPTYATEGSLPGYLAFSEIYPFPVVPNIYAQGDTEAVTGPIGQVNLIGFSPLGTDVYHFPQARNDSTYQFADTLAFTSGRHILYAGVDTRSINLNSFEDRNARPLMQFNGTPTASDLELAALGLSTVYATFASEPESFLSLEQRQVDLFVHDYFHVRPNLTVNAGVRVEISKLPNADTRLQNAFNPKLASQQLADETNACNAQAAQLYDGKADELSQMCNMANSDLSSASTGSFNQVFGSGVAGATPRVGVAWDPVGDGKTAVRAAWGMYETAFPAAVIDETRSAFDAFLPVVVGSPGSNSYFSVVNPASTDFISPTFQGLPPLSHQPGTLNLIPSGIGPVNLIAEYGLSLVPLIPTHLKEPYSYQFNVTVERKITNSTTIDVAYVGTLGRRLLQVTTPDGGLGPVANVFSNFGIGPSEYGDFAETIYTDLPLGPVRRKEFQSTASSSYNALQANLHQSVFRGFVGGLSFTYSHAIDNTSDFFDTAGEYALPQNSIDPSERGNSAFDVRFRTAGYFSWQLPSFRHNWLTKDWSLFGTTTAQTGQPYTVNTSVDINADGNATDRPLTINGLNLHPNTGDSRVQVVITDPQLTDWAYPANGQPVTSTIGRNTFRSAGLVNVDLALARNFVLPRGGSLILRGEAVNALNHADFGIPVRILEAPAFGTSVNTIVPARSIQLVMKLSF